MPTTVPFSFTRAQIRSIADALYTILAVLEESIGDLAPLETTRAWETAKPQVAQAASAAKPSPAIEDEDSPRGEMARRWRQFCAEHGIEEPTAQEWLQRAKGHFKTAMRLVEDQSQAA